MSAADPQDISSVGVRLDPPSHRGRNLAIIVAGVLMVAGFFLYTHTNDQRDDQKLARFDAFRAAYADKCNVPAYAGTQPQVVNNDFLTSPGIQAEVDRQLAALNAGGSCDDVVAKLKRVDLAVPAPGTGQ